jgi:hypothetical protein
MAKHLEPEYRPPHYAKTKDGKLLLDKETGTPIWCGSAASRVEFHKNQRSEELTKELETTKAKLAHYEKKYGRFETEEWQTQIRQDEKLYADRVGRKGP